MVKLVMCVSRYTEIPVKLLGGSKASSRLQAQPGAFNPALKHDGAKARGPLATRRASILHYCLGYGIQSLN